MKKTNKTPKQLERHLKGVANHRRVAILLFIAERDKDGVILEQLAEALHCNMKTLAEHTRRLSQAGLIEKKYVGRNVIHILSPYGKIFHRFLTTFGS